MRSILFLFFFSFISTISAYDINNQQEQEANQVALIPDHQEQQPYHFKINERRHLLSKSFVLEKEFRPFGIIKKSVFHITSVYDLYGKEGKFEARGSARMLTLGLFYDRATEIDLYDHNGEYFGLIDGQLVTLSQARFSFYDQHGALIAIAYVDMSGSGVLITHPLYEEYPLMAMDRKFVTGIQDHWIVSVYDPKIDARMLKIFSAFIVDRQNTWHKDD